MLVGTLRNGKSAAHLDQHQCKRQPDNNELTKELQAKVSRMSGATQMHGNGCRTNAFGLAFKVQFAFIDCGWLRNFMRFYFVLLYT